MSAASNHQPLLHPGAQLAAAAAVFLTALAAASAGVAHVNPLAARSSVCLHAVRGESHSVATLYTGSPAKRLRLLVRPDIIAPRSVTISSAADVFGSSTISCAEGLCRDVAAVYDRFGLPRGAELTFSLTDAATTLGYDGYIAVAQNATTSLGEASVCVRPTVEEGDAFDATFSASASGPAIGAGAFLLQPSALYDPVSAVEALQCNSSLQDVSLFPPTDAATPDVGVDFNTPAACRAVSLDPTILTSICAASACPDGGAISQRDVADMRIVARAGASSVDFQLRPSRALQRTIEAGEADAAVGRALIVLGVVILLAASVSVNGEETHKTGDMLYVKCKEQLCSHARVPGAAGSLQTAAPTGSAKDDTRKHSLLVAAIDVLCVVARLVVSASLRFAVLQDVQGEAAAGLDVGAAAVALVAQLSYTALQLRNPDPDPVCAFGGSIASSSAAVCVLQLFATAPLRAGDFAGLARLVAGALAALIVLPRSVWAVVLCALRACCWEGGGACQLAEANAQMGKARLALAASAWLLQLWALFFALATLVAAPAARAWAGVSTASPAALRAVVVISLASVGTGRLFAQCRAIASQWGEGDGAQGAGRC